MNLGQTMITLGMLILLIMTVISANRLLMDNNVAPLQAEALTTSAIVASDLLKEITRKPFDQKVVSDTTHGTINLTTLRPDTVRPMWRQDTTGVILGGTLTNPDTTKLTVYGKWPWGVRNLIPLPDVLHVNYYLSETWLKDVDDYDGYTRYIQYANPLVTDYYTLTVRVYYIAYSNPDVLSTTRSLFKQIDVTVVQSKYLPDPIKYSTIVSY